MNQTGRHWTEQALRRLADTRHALESAAGYTDDAGRLREIYAFLEETHDLYDRLNAFRLKDLPDGNAREK